MSRPKKPLLTYLSAGGNMNAICDQELLTRALQYRIDQQLMELISYRRRTTHNESFLTLCPKLKRETYPIEAIGLLPVVFPIEM